MRCMYCEKEKPPECFNREHVLPESFGRFQNALVLHEAVCADCNRYFGEELDLVLARSSSEGLERYSWHVKPADDVGQFRYGDVLIRLKAPDTGWDNALVRKVPTDHPGESQMELIPQAVFRRRDGTDARHVPLWELKAGDWRSDDSLDLESGIRVLAPEDVFDEVVAVLVEHGISFTTQTDLPAPQVEDGEVTVRHAFALTETLQRSIAKIAFNYFAYTNGPVSAVRPEFNAIRRFVRHGTSPAYQVVAVAQRTRLGNVRDDGQIPVVHYLTVERDDSGTALLAHVTLFHWVVYRVLLLERVPSDLAVKSSGHLYNVSDMACYEMARGPRR